MFWIFASVVLALAVYHEGFRKVVVVLVGLSGAVLLILFATASRH